MSLRRRSYFWRLLYAFVAGGLLPFLVLAVGFGFASARVLENAYRERAEEAVLGAAERTRRLLDEMTSIAETLALAAPVGAYLAGPVRDAPIVSEVSRLFSSTIPSSYLSPCLVPADGFLPLTRGTVPDEYRLDLYGGWGFLGRLSRESALPPSAADGPIVFGQPHPDSGVPAPFAVGCPVYIAGEIAGSVPGGASPDETPARRVAGYVIIDIGRQLVSDRIGSLAGLGASLTDLCITDASGCILYNMTDTRLESTFFEPEAASAEGTVFVPSATVPGGFHVYGMYPLGAAHEYISVIMALGLIVAVASLIISLVMAVFLSRSIARPVHLLTLTMEEVAQGRLDAQCPELPSRGSGDEISVLVRRFNQMILRVNELVGNLVAQERDLRRAETRALQAQINPHFLYNTLNSIRSMAKLEGSSEIADMTTRLARIMREGSSPGPGFCTVGHSMALARDYFAIESWRWPGRFTMTESLDEGVSDSKIPRLIIQPLVENALVHGLEEKPGSGNLTITGRLAAGDVVITVTDDGVGMSADRLERVRALLKEAGERPVESSLGETGSAIPGDEWFSSQVSADGPAVPGRSSGIALINTHRRLCLIYGLPYGLEIVSESGAGTSVTISFPRDREDERC